MVINPYLLGTVCGFWGFCVGVVFASWWIDRGKEVYFYIPEQESPSLTPYDMAAISQKLAQERRKAFLLVSGGKT